MSFHYSPKIVTNGLVFYLDAANIRSYNGTTSWYDLKNSSVATLTNGPTFSTLNNGSINFDGVDDYGIVTSNDIFAYGTGDFTWEVWFKVSRTNNNDYILDHGSNGGTIPADGAGAPSRYFNTTTSTGSPLYSIGFGYLTSNIWYHFVASRINNTTYLYKNGVFQVSDTDNHNYSAQDLNICRYGGNTNFLQGVVSIVRIYKSKGLTQQEVLQNYNATKTRFGL